MISFQRCVNFRRVTKIHNLQHPDNEPDPLKNGTNSIIAAKTNRADYTNANFFYVFSVPRGALLQKYLQFFLNCE